MCAALVTCKLDRRFTHTPHICSSKLCAHASRCIADCTVSAQYMCKSLSLEQVEHVRPSM